jgi:hypothetical protein
MNTAGTMIFGLFMGEGGNKPPKPSEPGLRLAGEYGTQAGFDLEFRAEGVIVGCGEAAILRQYKVAATPNGVVVTVLHNPAPFTLTLGADGQLSGSGTVRVDGRQVSNVVDGKVSYVPRSATCAMGVLGLGSGGGAVTAAGAAAPGSAAPAGSGGGAVLSVTVTAPTAGAPADGVDLALLNQDLSKLLLDAGFKAAPGKSLAKSFTACNSPEPNCLKGMQAIAGHLVARAETDDNGKASFPGVPPGTYYVMMVRGDYGPQPLVWSVKVELKGGQNTVALSPGNAIP